MKRWMDGAIIAVVGWLVFSGTSHAQDPIVIGLSVPMTGQYGETGKSIHTGVELAVKQINEAGGIQGRPLEIIIGDSQGAPDISKRVARKFISNPKIVAEIGDFTSGCSMAAQPIYDKAGMVQLSPTSSHPSFAPGSPFSFGIVGTRESAFMARAAVERMGKKRIAIAYLETDWGVAAKEYFIKEATQLGAEIVATESYLDGTTDFSATLKSLRAAQPDMIFLASMLPDAVGIAKQRQLDGWDDVLLAGVSALYTPEFLKLGGDAVENLLAIALFFPKDPRPEVQNFIATYQSAYQIPPSWFAAVGYDAMNVLADAIKQGGVDRKAIQQALASIKEFSGVTGKIVFSEHGDVAREYALLQVKQGEFVLFEGK
ncbi:ABC transporter substrate-binding protein [Candidatus Moduliflexus flocculans]|uniref:ABC transporter substrate-binding protein n=1 Tax=Candidatus Moduliflexus flocculans TaxID=1499966 RepID=A0A0S6W0J5_9BACT|nr:ABC transporter substrate-binding protein [Candidatus Moduliflexus flocculans]